MDKHPIHLIGNAHLDPAWLWHWPEGFSEARATFSSALERMNEYPDFIFTASAAALYQWIEKTAPEMFEQIRKRVAGGRWRVVGGWHTQSDCNIPSGESFARNALYSQRYFREKFGSINKTGYCVDSFGHCGSLPQLLARGGMKAYVFMRPMKNENTEIPEGAFIWEGTDGTRMPAFRIFTGYGNDSIWAINKQLKAINEKSPVLAMLFFGVGDHGGGPTKEMLDYFNSLMGAGEAMKYSSPDSFFEEIAAHEKNLPVWKGEMQQHSIGCFSAESRVKSANRRTEWMLLAAERLAAVAKLAVDAEIPSDRISAAWRDLLFCQFHDVLAGTCTKPVTDESLLQFGRAMQTAGEVVAESVQRVGGAVNTAGQGRALLVFNPHAFPFSGLVETDDVFLRVWREDPGGAFLKDSAGRLVPLQRIKAASGAETTFRYVLPADIPAFGWRLFHLVVPPKSRPEDPPQAAPEFGLLAGRLTADHQCMESEYLRFSVAADGTVGLRDLDRQWDVFVGGGIAPIVIEDLSDTWSHGLSRYDSEIGAFKLVSSQAVESGPLRATLRLKYEYGSSSLWLDCVLERRARFVEIRGRLDWHEKRKILKLAFPAAVENGVWTSEIPYGEIVRPMDGREMPMQGWSDISDADKGVAVINDGKYSVDARGGAMRIVIARSAPYALHDPIKASGDELCHDQGVLEFRLRILPHGPAWRGDVARLSHALNLGPVLNWEGTHAGAVSPDSGPAVSVGDDAVVLMALKPAEAGVGWIARAQALEARSGVRFAIPAINREWKADFKAGEVKTFLLDAKNKDAREVSFLE